MAHFDVIVTDRAGDESDLKIVVRRDLVAFGMLDAETFHNYVTSGLLARVGVIAYGQTGRPHISKYDFTEKFFQGIPQKEAAAEG